MSLKLLLVEDEKRMAQALSELLRQEAYDVDVFHDGNEGLNAALERNYDIIVLDVMLPGRSGYDITAALRQQHIKTPILMLTARDDLEDKITGLDAGADDYLTKPFMSRELLARLRALLRRSADREDSCLSYGDIILDQDKALITCTRTGQSVRLREKEFRLTEALLINQGRILGREQLDISIWGYENDSEYNNVEVYISFTRKKLAFIGSHVEIKAVRGLGYELRYENV